MKLLQDHLVLDFSQFLSAPSASLRLADLGARVIKVERPIIGDICRSLYVSDIKVDGESTIFHAINRNKESFEADIKDEVELAKLKKLIKEADVMIHNFRPGVMERLGLSYEAVNEINPTIIYASVSGYGEVEEWKELPGQDLLLQAISGVTYLSGSETDSPTPMGVAAADILAGTHLVQGVLAAIFERFSTHKGAHVTVNMLESLLDFQFEVLTSFYNDGHELPKRSKVNGAHAYIAGAYGIYKTLDGYIGIAMAPVPLLGDLLDCDTLGEYKDSQNWFTNRDEIKTILKEHLSKKTTQEWLSLLEPADIWCSNVFDYEMLQNHEGYKEIQMEQEVKNGGRAIRTTRCPIRVDNAILWSDKGAPNLGEHTSAISKEFNL